MAVIHIGTATTLATEASSGMNNGDIAYIWLNDCSRKMIFNDVSTRVQDTTNHPYYIRPFDFDESTNPGVWIESVGADQPEAWNGSQIRTGIVMSINWVDGTSGTMIDLDNEWIAIKDSRFGYAGIQMGWISDLAKANFKADADNYWQFDGSKVTWKGVNSELDASGNIICTGGTIGGFTLSATQLYAGTGATRIQFDTGAGIWLGATAFADAPFKVSLAGVLTATGAVISGAISASTIDIGGADETSFHVNVDGNMWAGAATYNIGTNPFAVSNEGVLRAVSGAIGGFALGENSITSTLIGLHSAGYTEGAEILLGHATAYASAIIGLKADGSGKLAAGNISWTNLGAITLAGALTSSATITGGTIQTASSGARSVLGSTGLAIYDATTQRAKIGSDGAGWLGASTTLAWTSAGVLTLGGFTVSAAALYTGAKTAYNDVNAGIHFGTDGIGIGNNVFTVSDAGALVATSATITGVLNANTGYLGGAANGWTITEGLLTANGTGIIQTAAAANTGIKVDSTSFRGYNGSVQTAEIATNGSGWFGLTGARAISWTTAGVVTIGGFTANATQLYAGSAATRIQFDTAAGIHLGATAFADAPFRVSLAGALVATSATITGSVTTTSGAIGGWTLGAGTIYSTNIGLISGANAEILLGHATTYADAKIGLKNDGSGKLASGNISWDVSGNLTLAGAFSSSATITGGTIQTGASGARSVLNADGLAIYSATAQRAKIGSDGSGWLGASDVFSWTSLGVLNLSGFEPTGEAIGVTFDGNTVALSSGATAFVAGPTGSPTVTITQAGVLTATGATISGTITATLGAIGGWSIGNDYIKDVAGVVGLSSAVTAGDDIRFWAGHVTPGSAPFRVTEAGVLTATGATITGTLTAEAGTIGGLTLSASALYTGSKTAYNDANAGVHFGTDGIGIGNNIFTVSSAGALVATSATITGAITANTGSIGSFTIGTYLYTGSKTAYNDANAGVHLGSDGIGFGNNVFTVSAAGALVSTSGTIAGLTINAADGLYAGTGATRVQMKPGVGIWTGHDDVASSLNYLNVDGSGWLADGNITWTAAGLPTITLPNGGDLTIAPNGDVILQTETGSEDSNRATIEYQLGTTNVFIRGDYDSDVFCIYPSVDDVSTLYIGYNYSGIGYSYENRFQSIYMQASESWAIYASNYGLTTPVTTGYVGATSDTTTGFAFMEAQRLVAPLTVYYCRIEANVDPDDGTEQIQLKFNSTTPKVIFDSTGMSLIDNYWIGLGSAAGRIEFDDQATDEINFLDCNVGINTSAPTALLHLVKEETGADGTTPLTYYYFHKNEYTINPASDSSFGYYIPYSLTATVDAGNAQDIAGITGQALTVSHEGSGTVGNTYGSLLTIALEGPSENSKAAWFTINNYKAASGFCYALESYFANWSYGGAGTVAGNGEAARLKVQNYATSTATGDATIGNSYIVDGSLAQTTDHGSYIAAITNAYGFRYQITNGADCTITNSYGLSLDTPSNSGSITNHYGIYLGDHSGVGGTLSFALYIAGGISYFGGEIRASAGILFGSDTAAANTLDDYEEGTWTMGVLFANDEGDDCAYSANTGYYTKIGNVVHLTGRIVLTSKGTSTGTAKLTGLPFTVVNNSAAYSAVALSYVSNISFADVIGAFVDINTTTAIFSQTTNAGVHSLLTNSNFADDSTVIVNITYRVA